MINLIVAILIVLAVVLFGVVATQRRLALTLRAAVIALVLCVLTGAAIIAIGF